MKSSQANFGKSSTKKVAAICHPKANKFLPHIEELLKMESNSIPALILTVLSSLTWEKEESSRDGIKDLLPWKKEKELLSSAPQILLMEKEDHLQKSQQMQLCTLKWDFWISKIKLRKSLKWANNKNWPEP